MASSQICILAVIILYLAFVVFIGVKYSKSNKTTEDYYLGGRKLGPLVTAMSAEASDMSSWLLLGIPGLAYAGGFADPFWTSLGLAIGTYFNWLIVAKKLRRYSQINNSATIPSFFSNRFGDDKNILSLISAVVIIVFYRDDNLCMCYHCLYRTRRFPRSIHLGSYTECHHDDRTCHHTVLRSITGRRMGCGL